MWEAKLYCPKTNVYQFCNQSSNGLMFPWLQLRLSTTNHHVILLNLCVIRQDFLQCTVWTVILQRG